MYISAFRVPASQILNAECSKNDVMFKFQLVVLLTYLFAYWILIGVFFPESLEPSKLHLHRQWHTEALNMKEKPDPHTHTHTHTRDCTCPQLSVRVCANSTRGGWRHLCVVTCTQLPSFSLLITLITHSSCFNKTLCSAIELREKKEREIGTQLAVLKNYFLGAIFAASND